MQNLYVSDLDGTLLNRDGATTKFTRDAINYLIKNNIMFTVASARGYESIIELLDGINISLPVVEVDGSYITDFITGRIMHVEDIPNIEKYELNYIFEYYQLNPIVSTYNGEEKKVYYRSNANKGMDWFIGDRISKNDKRLTKVNDLSSGFREQVVRYTLIDRKDKLEGLYGLLKSAYGYSLDIRLTENFYTPGWFWLSISSKRATKINSIKRLRQLMGLKNFKLVTFGDDTNDKGMIENSDIGIAMGNAKEEIKRVACETIGYNYEDSVVKYILKHEFGITGSSLVAATK